MSQEKSQPPPQSPKKPTAEEQEKTLRKVYFEILEGFTSAAVDGTRVRIKHFDLRSQTTIDQYYKEIYDKARAKGILTEPELFDRLLEDGTWTEDEEKDLQRREKALDGLRISSAKALNKKMREVVEENILKADREVGEIKQKKSSLIENTCEQFAARRSSDLIVKLSFWKEDKEEAYFTSEEFDLLERTDIASLIGIYNTATVDLTVDSIKAVTTADFFTSYYAIVEDNPSQFFNKPIHELTFFQVNLLNYARIFSSILKNLDPPDHIRSDPEKLLSFAKGEAKKRKTADKKAERGKSGPPTLG
jgi:hypothetical protein